MSTDRTQLDRALSDLRNAILDACDSGRGSTSLPAPYVTVKLAAQMTGLTEKAIRAKIKEGVWLENREYRRAPDGRLYISIRGFEAWVESGGKRKT